MSSSRPSRRTRQSRLNFTPVPSSSPAAAQLSPDVRHRAAVVDFDGSPRKKQRTGNDLAPAGTDVPAPITPKSSFPKDSNTRHSGSRGSVFGSATKASSGSPLKSVQDLEEGDNISDSSEDEPLPTSQRRSGTFWNSSTQKSQSTIGRTTRKNKPASTHVESDSDSEDMPTSAARRRGAPTSKPGTRQTRARAQESSNGSPQMGRRLTRGSRRSSGGKQKPVVISSDEEDSETPRANAVESDLGEAESSGDELLASSPGVKPKKAKGRRAVEVYSEDEDSEEEKPRRRLRRNARHNTASESEEDDMPTGRRRRRQNKKRADSESEDDEGTSGRMRSHQEQEDLEEDLEFLGTPAKSSRNAPRQKTARELALERLKRSRAGEKVDSVQDDEQQQPPRRRALYDTESESETVDALDEEEDEEEVEEDDMGQDELRPAIHQPSSMAMFQENDDDLDFIEDNEDDTLGVPDEEAQIPLEFSSISRRKAKDLFKFAVEWMVQKKLNPGFAMTDEIYKLTFRKLDDEVRALSDSKFTSSAWTKDFTRALHARPFIEVMEITGGGRMLLAEHCAACNRTNHPATWDIRFTGKPYHRETLEEIDDDDDDDDDGSDDDDDKSYNSQGLTIPSADRTFSTGVHCKTNAQTAHALAHWRYHLNEWVVDYLRLEDHLTPEKIVERDTWSTKQRRRYANDVVDDMDQRGEIKRLHQDFRTEIDHARNAKQAGWDRYNH